MAEWSSRRCGRRCRPPQGAPRRLTRSPRHRPYDTGRRLSHARQRVGISPISTRSASAEPPPTSSVASNASATRPRSCDCPLLTAYFHGRDSQLGQRKDRPKPALRLGDLRESRYAPVGQAIGICLVAPSAVVAAKVRRTPQSNVADLRPDSSATPIADRIRRFWPIEGPYFGASPARWGIAAIDMTTPKPRGSLKSSRARRSPIEYQRSTRRADVDENLLRSSTKPTSAVATLGAWPSQPTTVRRSQPRPSDKSAD
jgi:hypothetical protein